MDLLQLLLSGMFCVKLQEAASFPNRSAARYEGTMPMQRMRGNSNIVHMPTIRQYVEKANAKAASTGRAARGAWIPAAAVRAILRCGSIVLAAPCHQTACTVGFVPQ